MHSMRQRGRSSPLSSAITGSHGGRSSCCLDTLSSRRFASHYRNREIWTSSSEQHNWGYSGSIPFRKCTRSDGYLALFYRFASIENLGFARAELALFDASAPESLDVSLDGANWKMEHDGCDAIGIARDAGKVKRRGTIPIWTSSLRIRVMRNHEFDICNMF